MEIGEWEGCVAVFNCTVVCVKVYTMQIRPLVYPSPVIFGLALLSHPRRFLDNDYKGYFIKKENDDIYPVVMVRENLNLHRN